MKQVYMAAAFGLLVATPGFAADDNSQDDKVICKRDNTVGTRLAKRVCLTRAQWKDLDARAGERKRDLSDKSERFRDEQVFGPRPEGE